MACKDKRKYYVVSNDATMCYGYTDTGIITVISNLPWSKPYLFSSVSKAREIAVKLGYTVRFYPGTKLLKSDTGNL